MDPITIVNRLSIRPGKMDEFITTQREFGTSMFRKSVGLIGGRMYRSLDGKGAVLLSQFASLKAQEEIRQLEAFKAHIDLLQAMVESGSPELYAEAYTAGDFK